ncbi:amidase [Gemmobacter fulvus]|uniref:amidase n=1 Tax=Gemmobacter fulvus TaxID=2840474 RepID=UPI0027966FE5|nr:amidase [Gemmobacter fulvus]MDQ1850127.1 amidase [Gemmobacter fulvus]
MPSNRSSIAQIAQHLRDGRPGGAEALMQAAVAAHQGAGAELMAYKTWDGDRALAQARAADGLLASGIDLGPLMGLPVSVKDLFGVPGLPVFAGTDSAFDAAWSAAGPLVSRLLAQLGIVTGKTHTVEFAFGGLGVNAHWGAPVNPWSGPDGARAPGGSSSGAGVSLAEGSALLALGTDTAGSVRVPASFCGQAGLKTTIGRWSTEGIMPLSPSLDTPGLLARDVADLAYGFAALDPQGGGVPQPRDLSGLRIGLPRDFFNDEADAAILSVIADSLRQLEAAGAVLVDVDLPGCAAMFDIFRQGGLAAPELRSFLDRQFPDRIARLDPVVRLRVEGADKISAPEYLRRRAELALHGRAALAVFDHCDVLATPTVAIAPPLLADLADPAAYGRANILALRNTVIANLFGWCALTLPAGLDGSALPVGLQLIAGPFAEPALLACGQAVENRLGAGPELLGRPRRVS